MCAMSASLWSASAWEAVTLPSGLSLFVHSVTREARWHLPAGATVTQAAPWTRGIPAGESAWKQMPNSGAQYVARSASPKKPQRARKRGTSETRRRAKTPKVVSGGKQVRGGEPQWEAKPPHLPIMHISCIGTRAASDAAMEMAMHQMQRSRISPLPMRAGRGGAEAWSRDELHAGGQASARSRSAPAKKKRKRVPRAPKAGGNAKRKARGATKKPRARKKATPKPRATTLAAAVVAEAKAAVEKAAVSKAAVSKAASAATSPTAIAVTGGALSLSEVGGVSASVVHRVPAADAILSAQAPTTGQRRASHGQAMCCGAIAAATSASAGLPVTVLRRPPPSILAAMSASRQLSSDARSVVAVGAALARNGVTAVATQG